jgi:hypothetical protein
MVRQGLPSIFMLPPYDAGQDLHKPFADGEW